MVPMPSSRVPKRSFGLVVAAGLVLSSCGNHGRELPPINEVASGDRTQILAADGSLITELVGDERRESLPIDQIPSLVQNAVISIEDERFWQHSGVDPKGVLRAVRSNSAAGGVTQGGSTITQQYIKNVLLSPDQNIQRKIQEASLAYQLEKSYSKSFILEQYLNTETSRPRGATSAIRSATSLFRRRHCWLVSFSRPYAMIRTGTRPARWRVATPCCGRCTNSGTSVTNSPQMRSPPRSHWSRALPPTPLVGIPPPTSSRR